jgi:His-Xaa-Ser system radical SAM maturase HxsC
LTWPIAGQALRPGKMSAMRKVPVECRNLPARGIRRVTPLDLLLNEWEPNLGFLVPIRSHEEGMQLERLLGAGLSNITAWLASPSDWQCNSWPAIVTDMTADIQANDVVVLNPERGELLVLYRETDIHHSVLLTNRCNSSCLMCSQPPTRHDDSWLSDEAIHIARHMRTSPRSIGLSGGEPLLLGADLRRVLDAFISLHPDARIDVLTNGRLLAERGTAESILTGLPSTVSWLVPLYGHADFLHDFVVQSPGAFEETIDGLLALQAHGQPIQLRIVLIEPVLRILPELCRFIGRNLPFVREVALMACEPIGFALANRPVCEVDLAEWHGPLQEAAVALRRAQIPTIFMNTPLCALPASLWPLAHQSISDWKRTFPSECEQCMVKERCSGLFVWHEQGWLPTKIKAIQEALPS